MPKWKLLPDEWLEECPDDDFPKEKLFDDEDEWPPPPNATREPDDGEKNDECFPFGAEGVECDGAGAEREGAGAEGAERAGAGADGAE